MVIPIEKTTCSATTSTKKQRGKKHSSTCLHFFPGWTQRIPHLLGKKGKKILRGQLRMARACCAKGLTLCHKFCTGRRRSFPTAVLRNPFFEVDTARDRDREETKNNSPHDVCSSRPEGELAVDDKTAIRRSSKHTRANDNRHNNDRRSRKTRAKERASSGRVARF